MLKNFNLLMMINRRKLNQRKLADFLGIHESQVSKVVCGHINVTKEEKRAYAAALKCRIKEIF